MFLNNILNENKALVDGAIKLHQSGKIPPNTWILDLDTIYSNARNIAKEARSYNLQTYFMTKQIGRNPFAVKTALKAGIDKTVAVDVTGAKILNRYDIPLGHVGHLSQIPKHDYKNIIKMKPEVITIYSLETAKFLNEACVKENHVQEILIKVADTDGVFLPGQESGIYIDDLDTAVSQILKLNHIRIVGLTAFPCVHYNVNEGDEMTLTDNVKALLRGRKILEHHGIEIKQINTPGNTSALTMPLFQDIATHVEPGHGITGTTPLHYQEKAPEKPALIYVSEISHFFNGKAYAFGGGLYVCMGAAPKDYQVHAMVGKGEDLKRCTWDQLPLENIDYYGMLNPCDYIEVGDTVLFGFRPQMFITRANIAAVSNLDSTPILHGLFDSAGNMLDENYNVVPPAIVNEKIDEYLSKY